MTPVERLAATLVDEIHKFWCARLGPCSHDGPDSHDHRYAEALATHLLDAYPWLGAALEGNPRPLLEACGGRPEDPYDCDEDGPWRMYRWEIVAAGDSEVWVLPAAADNEPDQPA
jgi:hypothetical protein